MERCEVDIQGQSVLGHVWSDVKLMYTVSQYLLIFPIYLMLHIFQDVSFFHISFIVYLTTLYVQRLVMMFLFINELEGHLQCSLPD